jgi:hypothetical protein
MSFPATALSDTEKEEFKKENGHAIPSLAGQDPYAVP